MSKRILFFIPIFILMALTLVACAEEELPSFQASATKSDVDIRSIYEDDAVTFFIYNPSGIGDATLTLMQGEMPETVHVRIFVQGLENLELKYDDVYIIASVPTGSGGRVIEKLVKGETEDDLDPSSPYWIEIEALPGEVGGFFFGMPARPASFLVTLPEDFHTSDATEFHLSWVDFYR